MGRWIQVEKGTPNKPEIIRIAAALRISRDLAFGKCVRVWIWAEDSGGPIEEGAADGIVRGATCDLLDEIVGQPGIGRAMCEVGWLVETEDGLVIPSFSAHMGDATKARAENAKRQSRFKYKVKHSNAKALPSALPDVRTDVRTDVQDGLNTCPPDGDREPNETTPANVAGKPSEAPSVNAVAFQSWYAVYPRKVKPEAAAKAYAVAVTKIVKAKGCTRDEARAHLLDRAIAFAGSPCGQAGQFCPHPSSWLNAGSYDDDPKEWQRGNDQGKLFDRGGGSRTVGAGQRYRPPTG